MEELSQGLRVVFVLRDMEGLSLEQTAEALGLSLTAVKARSFRARLQLRERLSKYFKRTEEVAGVEPHSGLAAPTEPERHKRSEGSLPATEATPCLSFDMSAFRDSIPTLRNPISDHASRVADILLTGKLQRLRINPADSESKLSKPDFTL